LAWAVTNIHLERPIGPKADHLPCRLVTLLALNEKVKEIQRLRRGLHRNDSELRNPLYLGDLKGLHYLREGPFQGENPGGGSTQEKRKQRKGRTMAKKTEKNLSYAFAAESKASARNSAFAQKADHDGYPQIARLFRAISDAESVHARRYLRLMRGKIGSTEENLESAFQNEIKANVEEYPRLIKEALEEEDTAAEKAFSQSRDVESGHADLYKKAMNDLLSDRHPEYFVCQVCGYVIEDQPPEVCPVCGAVKAKFGQVL
jgi:rubrerythrin